MLKGKELLKAERIQKKWDHMNYVEDNLKNFPEITLVKSKRSNKFHLQESSCAERIKNPIIIDNETISTSPRGKYEVCEKCCNDIEIKMRIIDFKKSKENMRY